MVLFDKLKNFIVSLESRTLYIYLAAAFALVLLLNCGILYYYYSSVNHWKKRNNIVNELREQEQQIINRDQLVLTQRAQVNTLLDEMPDFKIEGYFTELLTKLGLERNKKQTAITYADRGDTEYREVLLNATFDTMNMKQLTELLDAIEQNSRIYTKELEIVKSKKIPNTIDVNLTIATLQRKPPELTETSE